ncbi:MULTISPECIES: helix-turn-helix transcriptional regulator [unclassified Massilia]|uniref:helix-turn-helix domain-containing protein n=1 Tax=unclassified Massilia TaxID=2609279 RepID=UPI0009EBE68B|nr:MULTISPECIES: helix-turn-helix transcriptional regulator [unclassified Massilia]
MGLLERFGAGLQRARKNRGLTQEDFSVVSSRTYLSSLERGMKSPTISKLEELASVIGIHPLSLLMLAYITDTPEGPKELCERITTEILSINNLVAGSKTNSESTSGQ